MNTYDNFDSAYRSVLHDIRTNGNLVEGVFDATSVGSSFGTKRRRTLEILGYSLILSQPKLRFISSKIRNIDYGYAYANLIWFLSGSDEVEHISHYNQKGGKFSDDGKHFAGSIGRRTRRSSEGDQFDYVVQLLKDDPSTRRAVITIFEVRDLIGRPKDTPCSICLHFFIRGGQLQMICNMRSQSALMVMPYDVHLFASLQLLLAAELNIKVGDFIHTANSIHVYEDEIEMLNMVLDEVPHNGYEEPDCSQIASTQIPLILSEEQRLRSFLQDSGTASFCPVEALCPFWSHAISQAHETALQVRKQAKHMI